MLMRKNREAFCRPTLESLRKFNNPCGLNRVARESQLPIDDHPASDAVIRIAEINNPCDCRYRGPL